MKILLLGFTKMKFMPYANFYLENIDTQRNDVSVLYWNRDLKDEDLSMYTNISFIEYRRFMEDSIPKMKKIKSFIGYSRYARKIINENKYDLIISLHTLPGLLVFDKLLIQYNKGYILDFRDVTFEYNIIFRFFINALSKHSIITFVSSDAYRKYLPSDKSVEIITSHNLLIDSLNHRDYAKTPSRRIRVAFWGLLRHTYLNKVIIDRLANDDRFELHYYGREQKTGRDLRCYSKSINANNVTFHGEYTPEQRYEFAKTTDVIHNIYLDTNMLLAMGNKYYDGVIFRIPQICMKDSQMASMCEKYGIGFSLDPQDMNFADDLYNYYTNIDFQIFKSDCDRELERVYAEYKFGCLRISEICNH